MEDQEYSDLGLKAGLEIHQQLNTKHKLFCKCPTIIRESNESIKSFSRRLHVTMSEMGEVDRAALEEDQRGKKFRYLSFDSTCLVEDDEEPPGELNEEALEIALEIALLLGMKPLDQVHVMRKMVIDGSNTSGFQRTALVAQGGEIMTENGVVRLGDLMIEEESAKRVKESGSETTYSLDRMGIPLVEISTMPDIKTPKQAQETASKIGMILRSTGRVKRGIGTIRQDINISIKNGSRVELKGVQRLEDIENIIEIEIGRQKNLIGIRNELENRDFEVGEITEVTSVFNKTNCELIKKNIDKKGIVIAIPLKGFQGLLGQQIAPGRRLGTEMSDYAKKYGVGGIFHTDELPGYGITEEEISEIRKIGGLDGQDAFALLAEENKIVNEAGYAVSIRAKNCIEDIPEETRGVKEDCTSRYMRPLPGESRMYPETDILPIVINTEGITIRETLEDKIERYQKEFFIDGDLATQIAFSEKMLLFEKATQMGIKPTVAIDILENKYKELRREKIPVENISDENFEGVFELIASKELVREGINELLQLIAEEPSLTAIEAFEMKGMKMVGKNDVKEVVIKVVELNLNKIKEEGKGCFSALMGECMAQLRGKAEGSTISLILKEEIDKRS